jgi:hypothetical protein
MKPSIFQLLRDPAMVIELGCLILILVLWTSGLGSRWSREYDFERLGIIRFCAEAGGGRIYWRSWRDYYASYTVVTNDAPRAPIFPVPLSTKQGSRSLDMRSFEDFHLHLWPVQIVHSTLDGWSCDIREWFIAAILCFLLYFRRRQLILKKDVQGFLVDGQ